MKRTDWIMGTSVVAVLLLIVWLLWPPPAVSFDDLDQARASIAAEGFHCVSDRADGCIGSGFVVSREEATFGQVNLLCKAGPLGPGWKGKVWVRSHVPGRVWTAIQVYPAPTSANPDWSAVGTVLVRPARRASSPPWRGCPRPPPPPGRHW